MCSHKNVRTLLPLMSTLFLKVRTLVLTWLFRFGHAWSSHAQRENFPNSWCSHKMWEHVRENMCEHWYENTFLAPVRTSVLKNDFDFQMPEYHLFFKGYLVFRKVPLIFRKVPLIFWKVPLTFRKVPLIFWRVPLTFRRLLLIFGWPFLGRYPHIFHWNNKRCSKNKRSSKHKQ